MKIMPMIHLTAQIDEQHQLRAVVPEGIPPGQVQIILLVDEDEAGAAWMEGIAREWEAELRDPCEDIYTLEDGAPVNESA